MREWGSFVLPCKQKPAVLLRRGRPVEEWQTLKEEWQTLNETPGK